MATATLSQIINFPDSVSGGETATHWGLWTELTGGKFLCGGSLAASVGPLTTNQNFRFASGSIVVTQATSANLSATGATRILQNGLLAGTRYVSIHSEDPGNTGANEINMARQSVRNWTYA